MSTKTFDREKLRLIDEKLENKMKEIREALGEVLPILRKVSFLVHDYTNMLESLLGYKGNYPLLRDINGVLLDLNHVEGHIYGILGRLNKIELAVDLDIIAKSFGMDKGVEKDGPK